MTLLWPCMAALGRQVLLASSLPAGLYYPAGDLVRTQGPHAMP
jgi:hypothetical protein